MVLCMEARDIEACTRCHQPILPGDEIWVEDGQAMHADHVVPAQSEQSSMEPLYS